MRRFERAEVNGVYRSWKSSHGCQHIDSFKDGMLKYGMTGKPDACCIQLGLEVVCDAAMGGGLTSCSELTPIPLSRRDSVVMTPNVNRIPDEAQRSDD
jgi:hypothetical protein